ncbi:MAG TPA: hypothetical protein VGV59_19490 [Pyrinomonadaceae bacterium]|nr:hypothetical protein [Pyrinomonadaceae bacterium]
MAYTITNLTRHLLVLPLNSGATLHLAPGETSGTVEDYELVNNAKVDKLMSQGMISSSAQGAPDQTAGNAVASIEGIRPAENA